MQQKHILIVDDHSLFRTGLKMILMQIGEARGISEAASIKEALDFSESGIDVILLDIQLPGINGIEGIKPLRDRFGDVPIIMLSANSEPNRVSEAKALGASGFLNKSSSADAMVASISEVLAGGNCFRSPPLESSTGSSSHTIGSKLTPRQTEVLIYLCEGKPNKLIARELDMSENTVRVHVSAILAALGASNRTEAMLIAQREGITS